MKEHCMCVVLNVCGACEVMWVRSYNGKSGVFMGKI